MTKSEFDFRMNCYEYRSSTLLQLLHKEMEALPLSFRPYFLKVSGFAGWQAPFMAQPAHPQPQDDFPFLLPRIILTRIAAATRTKTALMMIVAIFSISHVSIEIPPVSLLQI